MTTDLDERGSRAADAVDVAARGVGDPPPVASLTQRWRQRQRRRVATAALGVAVAVVAVVVAAPEIRVGAPEIGSQPTDAATQPETTVGPTEDPPDRPATVAGWTMTAAPPAFEGGYAADAAEINGRTVIVGFDGERGGLGTPVVWLGNDGLDWRRIPLGQIELDDSRYKAAAVLMADIAAADDGTLVAVGYVNFEPDIQSLAWISRDRGESWTAIDSLTLPDAELSAVTWGRQGFVAAGSLRGRPTVWWETDTGWTAQGVSGDGQLVAIAPLGDTYVAASMIGDSSAIYVTTDQETEGGLPVWEQASGDHEVSSLLPADGGVFAAGAARPDGVHYDGVVSRSRDGATWTSFGGVGLGGAGDQFVQQVMLADGENVIAIGSDRDRAMIWTLSGGHWEPLPRELFPDGSYVELALMIDGEPVVFGDIQRDGSNQSVMWQRDPS